MRRIPSRSALAHWPFRTTRDILKKMAASLMFSRATDPSSLQHLSFHAATTVSGATLLF